MGELSVFTNVEQLGTIRSFVAQEGRKLGGFGLYFMRSLVDEIQFEFYTGNGNTLTMVNRL
jgi:hypothetical protein